MLLSFKKLKVLKNLSFFKAFNIKIFYLNFEVSKFHKKKRYLNSTARRGGFNVPFFEALNYRILTHFNSASIVCCKKCSLVIQFLFFLMFSILFFLSISSLPSKNQWNFYLPNNRLSAKKCNEKLLCKHNVYVVGSIAQKTKLIFPSIKSIFKMSERFDDI